MLLRSLPPDLDDNGAVVHLQPARFSPLTYHYWRDYDPEKVSPSALQHGGVDHVLKVSYAFFHLLNYIEEPEMRLECMPQLGYLT